MTSFVSPTGPLAVAPGTVLSTYRVIREINRGGTAVVYEGDDVRTGTKVALKVLSLKEGKAAMPVAAIQREIEYAAAMQHENIVRLLDYFMANEQQMVIVWEIIDGPDLLDLLNERGGRLNEQQAAFYFVQLLRGVAFIHNNGLCHRDLKPENCMVERATNRLKIIDFGLSKHQHSAVTLGVGTPDYMAPELLGGGSLDTLYNRRTGKYDATATDVWAMGVLLYLLVTGQYPFEDPTQPQNVVATLSNIIQGRHKPFPRYVSPACVHLVHAMLTKDPAQRITLQGIAEHPWLQQFNTPRCAGAAAATRLTPPPSSHAPLSCSMAATLMAGNGGVCVAADVARWSAGLDSSFVTPQAQHRQHAQRAQQADDSTAMECEESGASGYMSAESSVAATPSPHAPLTLQPPSLCSSESPVQVSPQTPSFTPPTFPATPAAEEVVREPAPGLCDSAAPLLAGTQGDMDECTADRSSPEGAVAGSHPPRHAQQGALYAGRHEGDRTQHSAAWSAAGRAQSFSFLPASLAALDHTPTPSTPKLCPPGSHDALHLVASAAPPAQQAQHGLPPRLQRPPAMIAPPVVISAVRPPSHLAAAAPLGLPTVPVLVETHPGGDSCEPFLGSGSNLEGSGSASRSCAAQGPSPLKCVAPLIPAQSLLCSPTAQQAQRDGHKRARLQGGVAGLCRFWFGGRSSSCGEQ